MQKEEEKGRVIFFPVKHFPSFLEMEERKHIQDMIKYTWQQIRHECKDDPYAYRLRVEMFANILRSKWKLIDCKNIKKEE